MLSRAKRRIERNGRPKVELIEADLPDYALPPQPAAPIAAFAVETVPEYDTLVSRIAASLAGNGRIGLLGLSYPESWPEWLIHLGVLLNKPSGANREDENSRHGRP